MRAVTAGILALLVVGCPNAPAAVDQGAEVARLMQTSREWSAVASSGDIEAIIAYWDDDAVMMAPGQPPLRGKQAIREYVEGSATIPGFGVKWEPLEGHVSISGDLGYLVERNEFSYQDSTGTQITEANKVVTVWKKQADGSWKNVVDMWNADPTAWKR